MTNAADSTDVADANGESILSNGLYLYISGSKAYVKATGTAGGTATLTATFTKTGSDDTGKKTLTHYTATYGTNYSESDGVTVDGTSVKATFYDYYYDNEVNGGWLSTGNNADNTSTTMSTASGQQSPYKILNKALSEYAGTSANYYQLYFGDFWYDSTKSQYDYKSGFGVTTDTSTAPYAWLYRVNNSNDLIDLNSSDSLDQYYYAVTGLAGSKLSNGNITYSDNSTTMALFNEDFLAGNNNVNKTLASAVDTTFPVRVEKKSTSSTIYFAIPENWTTNTKDNGWYEATKNNGSVYCYLYNSSNGDVYYESWNNETAMTRLTSDDSYYYYSFTIDGGNAEKYDKVIFHAGSSSNKEMVQIPGVNEEGYDIEWGKLYEGDNAKWTTYMGTGATTSPTYDYYTYDSTEGQDNVWFSGLSSSTTSGATINYGQGEHYSVLGHATGNSADTGYGFFPFDYQNRGTAEGTNDSTELATDYGFGVKLEIKFTLGDDGYILASDNTTKVAQKFTYSGDDDLWVYVDGQLVLDLGGDHRQTEGYIDFSGDGSVYRRTSETATDSTDTSGTFSFSDLGVTIDNNNTNLVHTMTIYYMERGMDKSNLQFGYNLTRVGNEFDVTNTIDASSVNAGLQSAVSSAVNSDTFSYAVTDSTDTTTSSFSYGLNDESDTTSGSISNGGSLTITGSSDTDGASATFVSQYTVNDTLKVVQTAGSGNKYTYTTSNSVNDIETGETVKTTDGSTTETGTFTFVRTDGSTDDLAVTHLSADYVNTVQTKYVTIGKTIGNYVDNNTTFNFTVAVTVPGDSTAYTTGLAYVTSTGSKGTTTDTGISLKDGETATLYGIPVGATVVVTENTPTTNAAKCYELSGVTVSDDSATTNGSSTTFTVANDNTVTVTNNRMNYCVEYLIPTRLYGNSQPTTGDFSTSNFTISGTAYENYKIYRLTGILTSDMFDSSYAVLNNDGSVSLTDDFVKANKPYNDIFNVDVTWDSGKIVNASSNETAHTDEGTSYDLYSQWAPTEVDADSRTVNVQIDTDGDGAADYYFDGEEHSGYTTHNAIKFMSTITGTYKANGDADYNETKDTAGWAQNKDGNYYIAARKVKGDKDFTYWAVYQLNDDGTYDDTKEVTRCYTRLFMYTAYDNYFVKAVYGGTDDNISGTIGDSSYTSASAYIIDVTRSHWNDTTSGSSDNNSSNEYNKYFYKANTEYDRIYFDFELAYNYKGLQLNTYEGDDIKVGFKVYIAAYDSDKSDNDYEFTTVYKTVYIDLSKLDNKNRIEYFYDIKNFESSSKNYVYKIVPIITDASGNEISNVTTVSDISTTEYHSVANATAGSNP